jgi:hypothetical protein
MKTEEDVRVLLQDAARAYETPPPPTPLVIGLGRRSKRRRGAWTAGAAAAAVIVVAAVGGLILRPGDHTRTVAPIDTDDSATASEATASIEPFVFVPSIIGLDQATAVRTLELTGLTVIASDVTGDCTDDEPVVIAQSPDAGQRVRSGSKVYINVGVVVCGLSADDRRVVQRFEEFAADPSAGGPFAHSVALGLGNEFRKTITGAEQTDPGQWHLDLTGYAERSGALAVLDLVAASANISMLTTDVRPSFCPTTLVDQAQPELTAGGRPIRIRILQPPGSCSQLATVDLYVNDADEVVGVNVGLGAP